MGSYPAVNKPFHHSDLCFPVCFRSPLQQESCCPVALAELRTLHLNSAVVTPACSSLLFLADPHRDGVQKNWSGFGASVAEMGHSWVGRTMPAKIKMCWKPCGEWGVMSNVGLFPLTSSHLPQILALLMARTGWDRASPEMQGLCPRLLLSSHVPCLGLQRMRKSV